MDANTLQIEAQLFLKGVFLRYGYDFRHYAPESIHRRLEAALAKSGAKNLSELQGEVLRNPAAFERLLATLTVGTTEMFRDPSFFRVLLGTVLPLLATYPSLKIWHAGCSSGEEVYSLAILLQEAGLYSRALIYATDINVQALERARQGIYAIEGFQEIIRNYQATGAPGNIAEHCHAAYGSVSINAELKKNIVFAQHNLATDGSFGEMHLIICRNVLIYFGSPLQERVLQLFESSLISRGFLCLGRQETLMLSSLSKKYEEVDERIYQRKAAVPGH